ncbi:MULTISPECIES: sodium:calcium antiporter [unclassified Phenylobacterium]|uniref:sodium:calcium antiporter n=1 Tax=unclassified Phenylobacterium TaxID=2640670 RepID=UPI000839F0D4|nr:MULTISPECIES: sodium:calcium antiporter [unclassified Phenylobacterium]
MTLLDFGAYPLWANLAIFGVAAAVVWWAGSRLTRYADAISEMTGLGSALAGMLLLGGITSLPEVAVSTTASLTGNARLAVSNLLGGVAAQVVIIAIGDAMLRGRAMSAQVAGPTVLLQAVFSCLLLAVLIAGALVGDIDVAGVGAWSAAAFLLGVTFFWMISRYKGRETWRPNPPPEPEGGEVDGKPDNLRRAIGLTAAMGATIFVAGYLLSQTADAIARQSGISDNFVGVTLLALATSLPEISTVVTAVLIRRYMMAFSDIFGTNIFDLMLIFVIDVAYRGPPVLNELGVFAAFAALLGIVVTLLYVAGLIERRDKTTLRLGPDSWAVLAVYAAALPALYVLGQGD